MKFSNKDLLLLFGILVAVIVTLTTIVYTEQTLGVKENTENAIKPTSLVIPSGLIKKTLEQIDLGSLIR